MRTATDALRSLRRYVWCALQADVEDFSGNPIEWEVRYWSTEGENKFPFVKVAATTSVSTSGSAVQRDLVQTFAVHAYVNPQPSPEEMVMEAARVTEIFFQAFDVGISYTESMPSPSAAGVAMGSGGALAADTYVYNVTAVNASGETLPSPDVAVVVVAGGSVQLAWFPVEGALTYNVYRRALADGVERLVASQAEAAWTDTGVAGSPQALPVSSAAMAKVAGGPRRVPLYDYDGVPLDGEGSATTQRGPADFLRVQTCSYSRMDDPEDDRYTLVIVEPRLTWRRAGRLPGGHRVVREVVLSQDPA